MTTALSRSSHPPRASNESVISDVRTTSSPSSSPNMSGQRSSGGGGGRIGLSEYTAQRLAELRARRAEVEADFKQGGTTTASPAASIPPQHPAPPTTVSSPSSSSSSSFSSSSTAVVVQSTPQPPKPPKPSAVWNNPTRHGSEVTQLTSGGGGLSRSSVVVNGDSPPPPPAVDPPFVRRRPLDCADAAVVVTRPTEPAPPVPPAAPRRSTTTTTVSNARSVAAEVSNGFAAAAVPVRTQQSPSSVGGGEKKPGVPRYSPSPSHSRSGAEEDDEVIGFASLPEQVHRKAVKRGFDFTLMVVGDSGLGKSTLISCLFMNNDLYKGRIVTTAEDRISKTVAIDKKCVDIEERGVKLRLTIVDTPGFNETIDAADCWKPIEDYIEQQYEQYLNDENGLNRKNIVDSRVHCCLYFLSPCSHGMRQVDVEVMQRLQRKVNLVPIIAKSDTLTPTETKRLKSRIRAEIEKHKIRIYEFPDCDSDEDEEFKKQDADLKSAVPFAVVGSNTVVEVAGRKLRGRPYPWGVVEVDNPSHSDFAKLRQFLISTHMQDLKDVTRDVHYENYRARHIQEQMIQSQKERKLKRDSVANFDAIANADEILLQKDQELEQMREMLKKMESQLTGNRGVSDIKGLGNL